MSTILEQLDPERLSIVLVTDCGSTTTKAVLFERKEDGWHQTFRGEAPTTVEKPVANVTIGALNAFLEIQELSGRRILRDTSQPGKSPLLFRANETDSNGIDLYLSTSSAGGGLQMIVAGVVASMTTISAERAALGAGAIVMDAVSIDDGREPYERVQKIRHLRPDIVLIAGGTEGGSIDHPLELAEMLLQADPKPRFGETLRLPVIYAANSAARESAERILGNRFAFVAVDNLRPDLERENLAPARDCIHELFLHHVMSHAPGYRELLSWTPAPIMPTPAAVGDMVLRAAERQQIQILAADIGGATTDVFSVFRNPDENNRLIFNRTVSANLGMSYSVANVLLEAGDANIRRWLPFSLSGRELRDRLRNKMIRPTSVPYTMEDLIVEQAVCREALRLALVHHKRLATGLRGAQRRRTIGDLFKQQQEHDLVQMLHLDLIIGSGGVLSHAPERKSAAFMLLDAYEPEGVTRLAVDSIFMMPHLGVLSSIHPKAATEILHRDCLIDLGTVIAPVGPIAEGTPALSIALEGREAIQLVGGELRCIELAEGNSTTATLTPLSHTIDVGAGPGKVHQCTLWGGHAGIILDGRGRPLSLNLDSSESGHALQQRVASWYKAFNLPYSG